MFRRLVFTTVLLSLVVGQSCWCPDCPPDEPNPSDPLPQVTFVTTRGTFVIELFTPNSDAAQHLLALAADGYYDGTIVHHARHNTQNTPDFDDRVPQFFEFGQYVPNLTDNSDEPYINESNNGQSNTRGRVAMFGPRREEEGTPFLLVNLADNSGQFDYVQPDDEIEDAELVDFTVIGRISRGIDVVDDIARQTTFEDNAADGTRLPVLPVEEIRILGASVSSGPIANAGPDETVYLGDEVELDGEDSWSADGADDLTYLWEQVSGASVDLDDPTSPTPTFPAEDVSTLIFELIVTSDETGRSNTDSVTITVRTDTNQPPVADAGEDQSVAPEDEVELDGTGSTDPDPEDGDELSFAWEQIDGIDVELEDADKAEPSFTAPEELGDLVFELTLTDTEGGISTDTVTVSVVDDPIADAGEDQVAGLDEEVTLDGSGSQAGNPDDQLAYAWEQLGGPTVTPTGQNTSVVTFTTPSSLDDTESPFTLTFEFTATDGQLRTDSDTVVVQVIPDGNGWPIADAGDDQIVLPEVEVTLDGSGSTDPEGGLLLYKWSQIQPTDPDELVEIDDRTAEVTTFDSPHEARDFVFELTVTDDNGGISWSQVAVTVLPIQADAGVSQTVLQGDEVELDGSDSVGGDPDDEDLLAYEWVQIFGPAVVLDDPTAIMPTFTAPLDEVAGLTFELTVTADPDQEDSDRVVISVRSLLNQPPIADAGNDQTVATGAEGIELDGSDSSDPDVGDTITYLWTQTEGPSVVLEDADTENPTFDAPSIGLTEVDLVFVLEIADDLGGVAWDDITVTVTPLEADAGEDRNVVADLDVTLGPRGEDAPDEDEEGVSFDWEQISGEDVELSDPESLNPTFTVPDDAEDGDQFEFELTVTGDKGDTDTDDITLTVVGEPKVRMVTTMGEIVIDLPYGDPGEAPITTLNFLQYVEDLFYDGTIFHRVMLNFVDQGGGFLPGLIAQEPLRDPIVNEFSLARPNVRGTIAMAKTSDPDSATSQFFFNVTDNPGLDDPGNSGGFTVFADTIVGLDVVDDINAVDTAPQGGHQNVPVEDIIVNSMRIE